MTSRRTIFYLAIGAALAAALAACAAYAMPAHSFQSDRALAREVVSTCAQSARGQRDACYEKTIPALMDTGISMERAFSITAMVQEMDPAYHYCHVLAHLISSKETAKDPSKWKDVIARSPSGVCGNGALHGAFQERFRSETMPNATADQIVQMLQGACDPRDGWDPTLLERSSCMHGMGHLLVFITDANIQKSLALCSLLGTTPEHDFVETCDEGVFMQIYQPLEPEEKILVARLAPSAQVPETFCRQFSGIAFATCIKESWPTKRDSLMTPQGFEAVCAPLVGLEGYDNCIRGLTYVVMGMKEYNSDSMLQLCARLSSNAERDMCVARTAERFIETDWRNIPQAISVCRNSEESRAACWDGLVVFATQGMKQNSAQTRTLCGGMPEPWRSRCLAETNTTL